MGITFFFTNIMLGVGLAMDAFSVSLANGLSDHDMKRRKMLLVAGTFAIFQALMPFIGWLCVHTLAEQFEAFQKFIPWIALALLSFIGGKMLYEGICCCKGKGEEGEDCECDCCAARLTLTALLVQGIATSIDALSVGFTIAEYSIFEALIAVLLIAAVTLVICTAGILIGKKFGAGLEGKATILGGAILVVIGIYIFIKGMIG